MDTFTVMLPAEKRTALAHYQKRAVILGIRPEDLYEPATRKEGSGSSAILPVEVVERTGGATYVYLLAGHTAVVARLDARTSATAGRPLEIAVDPSHIHLFDPDTEQVLRAW
jgi:multiple sugar transport system ATP-binding protein